MKTLLAFAANICEIATKRCDSNCYGVPLPKIPLGM